MIKASKQATTDMYMASKVLLQPQKIQTSAELEANDATTCPPLKAFSLRGNQLCGSILIGNYNFLTQLEVSENEMEALDLSALTQLEKLKCSHNKLMELIVNGAHLCSVIASDNCLHALTVTQLPTKLIHLDISQNYFAELPKWIGWCGSLDTLLAHHNQLRTIDGLLTNYSVDALRVLNIAYNSVHTLHLLPEKVASVQQLYLQSNRLLALPQNFFVVTRTNLRILNASCNQLAALGRCERPEAPCVIEELLLSNNNLDEHDLKLFVHSPRLRVLHAAYNKIGELPPVCVRSWPDLETLVLSGNTLQHLPDCLSLQQKLQVLRVHSNLLLSTPVLSKLPDLKVLDLAHNHLDRINLASIMPTNLQYLDLSCNLQLQVDESEVRACQSQRNWRLVDVSGRNRACLPTTKLETKDNECNMVPRAWILGFSETPGKRRKLLVSQLRQPNYGVDECLFGMFESSASVKMLARLVPAMLQRERAVPEATNCAYMKRTLRAAQQEASKDGAVRQLGVTLCHIAREHGRAKSYVRPQKSKKFVLRVASTGDMGVYLVRKTSNVCLSLNTAAQQRQADRVDCEGAGGQLSSMPDPEITELILSNDDEYLVICNGHAWTVLDVDRVAREIRKEENVVLAAKRIQDVAQSFGADENLSVIVVRFRNIGTDVDHLIKELKKTVRRHPDAQQLRTCCVRSAGTGVGACCHRLATVPRPLSAARSDRSSPSGQSDQALNILNKDLVEGDEMDELNDADSVLSEEQFKCWEYMLEQNTQLLFDKELNTISKSLTTNNRNVETKLHCAPDARLVDSRSNLIKSVHSKLLSHSSPQLLAFSEAKKPTLPPFSTFQQQVSFLSKHFGSSRSFQNGAHGAEAKSRSSLSAGTSSRLGGGPNAAYFGSLQRLIPYNLEYDFAVMQERSAVDEEENEEFGEEHGSRIRKYWGVATTEL